MVKANAAFALDQKHKYVLAASDIEQQNLNRWHGQRNNKSEPFDPKYSPLRGYMGEGRVKQCPGMTFEVGFEAGCGGYGYNSTYIGGRYDKYGRYTFDSSGCYLGCGDSASTTEVKSPSQTVMFTDAAFMEKNSLREYSFSLPPFWHLKAGNTPSSSRPNPSIHFRHLETVSVAWVDGHVTGEKLDYSAPYMTHANLDTQEAEGVGLGWFGPDNNSLFDLK